MNRKYSSSLRVAANLATIILFAACSEPGVSTVATSSLADSPTHVTKEGTQEDSTMNLSQQLAISKEDLAGRLSIDADLITVSGVRKVNWRSSALGCPSPGMSYTEALVPGVLIMLEANSKGFGYHAKLNGRPFLCPRGRVEKPASIQTEDLA